METRFAAEVRRNFKIDNVVVVNSAALDDVAYIAAMQLLRAIKDTAQRIKETAQKNDERREIFIGFSGGYTSKQIVRVLADLFSNPSTDIPATLVFVALVAGFDPSTPGNDPTSFFTYLDLPLLRFKTRFLLIHAAPFIESQQRERALRLPGVATAAEAVPKLDFIVTSTADAHHEHSMLRQHYERLEMNEDAARGTLKRLEREGWRGDCLWLPIGEAGPIDMGNYPFEPFSIVRLSDFPSYIDHGKRIFLVVGPCGHPGCFHLKNDILRVVLRHRLASHLIVDSRTARAVISA